MGNLTLEPTWEAGIRQLETTDLVQGGANGNDNIAPTQLGNRTEYLERCLRAAGYPSASVSVGGPRVCCQLIESNGYWTRYVSHTPHPPAWFYTPSASSATGVETILFWAPCCSGLIQSVTLRYSCWTALPVPTWRIGMALYRNSINFGNEVVPVQVASVADTSTADQWKGVRELVLLLESPSACESGVEHSVVISVGPSAPDNFGGCSIFAPRVQLVGSTT